MTKMNWGKAKFEILCLKNEIISGFQRGENLSEMHRNLKAEGRINASLPSFIRLAKEFKSEAFENFAPSSIPGHFPEKTPSVQEPTAPPPNKAIPVESQFNKSFNFKEKPDIDPWGDEETDTEENADPKPVEK